MRTNRDLYEYVVALPASKRPLADYLRALAALAMPHRAADGIGLEQFTELLREALTSDQTSMAPEDPNAFEELLWRQVEQLGQLKSGGRQSEYVKVRNSDARWYNAYVDGFLERGAEGAFHGWDAEGEDLEEMPFLTWDDLRQFLIQGQYNE